MKTLGLPVLLTLFFAAMRLLGQAQPDPKAPAFDVASIKPTSDDDLRFVFHIEPDGTVSASGITLKRLLMTASNVQGFRIVGGPDWVAAKRWNVQAKHTGMASLDAIRSMLRGLCEERFQLHTRGETQSLPVYELVVDRKGLVIPRPREPNATTTVRAVPGSLRLTNATSATFASQLSYSVARPVIDKTNLRGTFDFALEWTPIPGEDGGPTTAGLPPAEGEATPTTLGGASIFTAIREQLGLRLNPARGPVDVLVIDHVERPTPD